MPKLAGLGVVLLMVAGGHLAAGQDRTLQYRPELDTYLQLGSQARLIFADSSILGPESGGNSAFSYYLEVALRPLLRRELRDRNDVFRKRYLTLRGGYRYLNNLAASSSDQEHRLTAEMTGRYSLPWGLLLADRNLGEFRFRQNLPFSMRYRNRLRLDRTIQFRRFVLTPFAYEELFYDTRYGEWARNRTAIGVQIPIGPHLEIEPYGMRQNNTQSAPRHSIAAGLTVSCYF